MPGLLDLPNEIVYSIVHRILQARIELPPGLIRSRVKDWPFAEYIAYVQNDAVYRPNHASAIALLLTCRKISGQTLHYLKTAPCVYGLDLAIVNAKWFLPTWTSVTRRPSVVAGMVDRLEISLTPCRTGEEGLVKGDFPTRKHATVRLNTPWLEHCTYTGSWENTMWALIDRFLAVGASGRNRDLAVFKTWSDIVWLEQTFLLNLRVQTIVIDVDTPDFAASLNTPISHDIVPARQVHDLIYSEHNTLYHVSAKNCADIIKRLASGLAEMLTQAQAGAFKPFFERVGKFQFCVNGKMVEEIDVADFMYLEHIWDEPEDFEERKEMVRTREELGL